MTEPDAALRRGASMSLIGRTVIAAWATAVTLWLVSGLANVPLPAPAVAAATNWALGRTTAFPPDVNFLDLYTLGHEGSLLRTYAALANPQTWRRAEMGPGPIDWLGHAEGIGAIGLYTLLGLCVLGALGIRWPWPTRLAVAYALGLGMAGWVFEQLAIAFLLNRWTVLGVFALLFGAFGAVWRRVARADRRVEMAEPELGAPFATSALDLLFRATAWALLALIVALSFYHAVCFPPTNWDALILYLGYARQTHEAGGFPIKVVAQVGIGLGANYPHLFEVTQAAITRLGGHWSPLVGQWAVPWASLCSTVLVFALAHRLFRRRDLALAAALVFRSIPYGVSFSHLVSNYPLATLLCASLLLAAHDFLVTGRHRYATAMLALAAAASHVNYLMPALWGIAVATLVLRWLFEQATRRTPARHPWTGVAFVLLLAVGLSWHVRNWAVTGNPVYAFFPELLGGRNINPEVLASADAEWRANGDGLGALSAQIGERTPLTNLLHVPRYLLLEPVFRWKLAPLFAALALPGLLMLVSALPRWRRHAAMETPERAMFWMLPVAVFMGLWGYHLALGDHYLYQILPMLVPASLFAVFPLALGGTAGGLLRGLVIAAALLVAVPFSLMGFKMTKSAEDQLGLGALTHPFPDVMVFYNRVFPGDVPIWQELERRWRGATVLTHDNRHLIYDPLVEIVHLDDWDVQRVYGIEDPAERLAFWRERGIDLYLRIPNEARHRINARAGLQALISRGDLRLVLQSGENALYAFPWARPRENGVAGARP